MSMRHWRLGLYVALIAGATLSIGALRSEAGA